MTNAEAAEEIKHTVDMQAILDYYGYTTDRSGFMRCPFHTGDHTASLKVYKGNKGWTCFGCHKGGTVIDFVMEEESCGFADAVKRIDEAFNLHLFVVKHIDMKDFLSGRMSEISLDGQYKKSKKRAKYLAFMAEWALTERFHRYQAAISKKPADRTDDDWWTIKAEEYFEPEEQEKLVQLWHQREVSFNEWKAEKGGSV